MVRIARGGLRGALVVVMLAVCATAQIDEENLERRFQEMQDRHARDLEVLRRDYEGRIQELELTVGGLRGELDEVRNTEDDFALEDTINLAIQDDAIRVGIGDFGQTNIFDNMFNPAVSVVGDFVLSATDLDDSFESNNRFTLRSLELGIVGRVDPLLAYYVYIHFDEEEVELEEAFGRVDSWLPDTLELKFGRYNVDFGKLSPVHDHDLGFVDKPQVLQEYLGGSLRGTGVTLHHWLPIGDAHILRWSAGIVNGLDGDAHAIFGPAAGENHHEEEGAEAFGERGIENFAFLARVTGLFEIGEESTLQVGASVAWAPEDRRFFELEPAGGAIWGKKEEHEVFAVDLERLLVGFDATFKWRDPATGRGLTLAGEVLLSRQEFYEGEEGEELLGLGAAASPADVDAWGFYTYGLFEFDRNWSLGASGGWFEHAEDQGLDSWDAGVFLTWKVDEFNRLRLEARYFDDPDEEYLGVMFQWTVILGSHGHGLDF